MLNPFFYPYQGGTEKHVREVGKRLADRGFDITILCNRMPKDKKEDFFEGMHVRRINSLLLINSIPPFFPVPPPVAITPAMSSAIKELIPQTDLFHIHNRFVYSPSDAKNIKEGGSKLCLTLHNAKTKGISPAVDFFGTLYDRTYGKDIMKECDHIFGVSQNTIDVTVPRAFRSKASVSYNGVDCSVFKPGIPKEDAIKKYGLEGRKVIFTICRLEPQKGLMYMVSALRKLIKKDKSYVWVLAGTGSQQAVFEALSRDPRLRKNIVFIGKKMTEPEVTQLYSACDLFVLPSVWEPFGIVVCEAMAVGKPVVTTTAGGLPEIVTSQTGILVPPKSGEALYRAIMTMFSNPQKMRRMGVAGMARARSNFTWDKTAQNYVKLYERLL